MISDTINKYGESGIASYNYMMSQNYYKTYKNIIEKAKISVIPESKSGGSSSDSLAIMSMMMNGGLSSGNSNGRDQGNAAKKPANQNQINRNFSIEDKIDEWTTNIGSKSENYLSGNTSRKSAGFDLEKLINDTTFYPDPSLYKKK